MTTARAIPCISPPALRCGCRSCPTTALIFSKRIAGSHRRRAVALPRGIPEISARARIHRSRQHESRRKCHRNGRPCYRHHPVLQRLPHHFQHVALKFRQLIQKQHPMVPPNETSPGRGTAPPPISPASLMVWCGERNGLVPINPWLPSSVPATLWIRVVSIASSSDIGGRIVGIRFASMVFPRLAAQ
jgi:hypothetical protein